MKGILIVFYVVAVLLLTGLIPSTAAPYLPEVKNIQFRPRLGKENVRVIRLNGETFASGKFQKHYSLNGIWKFKGLDYQEKPFGKMHPEEKSLMAENLDDSKWSNIDVPLNWWLNPQTAYHKVPFKNKPYFRGYYRKKFTLLQLQLIMAT